METLNEIQYMHAVSEIQLIYKRDVRHLPQPKIQSSKQAYEVLMDSWDHNLIDFVEEFKILLLNGTQVLAICNISLGGTRHTIVDPKLIFTAALKINANGIILAHNHPSGILKPSDQDLRLTKDLVNCGKMMDILILDHHILTSNGYFSFADKCLI